MTDNATPIRLAALAACAIALLAAAPAGAKPIKSRGTWTTTLQPRDIDGDGVVDAYYDTDLDITWAATPTMSGKNNWNTSMDWVATLSIKGVTGWHLPKFNDPLALCNYSDTGGTNCGYKPDPSTSDMAHMFYVTLGNIGSPDAGYGLVNTGPFTAFDDFVYWTRTKYNDPTGEVWSFQMKEGRQQRHKHKFGFYGWPVHDGDVPHKNQALPSPASE
jgi:hypothetical protein